MGRSVERWIWEVWLSGVLGLTPSLPLSVFPGQLTLTEGLLEPKETSLGPLDEEEGPDPEPTQLQIERDDRNPELRKMTEGQFRRTAEEDFPEGQDTSLRDLAPSLGSEHGFIGFIFPFLRNSTAAAAVPVIRWRKLPLCGLHHETQEVAPALLQLCTAPFRDLIPLQRFLPLSPAVLLTLFPQHGQILLLLPRRNGGGGFQETSHELDHDLSCTFQSQDPCFVPLFFRSVSGIMD